MGHHAILSPSSAERWLNCTPSARLEEKEPDTISKYAEEGTLAHRIAELKLKAYTNDIDKEKATNEIKKCKANDLFYPGMIAEVDEYIDFCKTAELEMGKDSVLLVEQKIDLNDWAPDSFGTGDCVIIGKDYIHIIDLKFGKGQIVDPVENPQLKLYALGAYSAYGFIYDDIKEVWVTIAQVRLGEINTYKMDIDDLLKWGKKIKPIAKKAYKGEGKRCAGSWCTFCKVRATCKRRAEYVTQGLGKPKDPDVLTPDEIAEYLTKADLLKAWAKDLESYALSSALKGEVYPGWKLVEGRSNRKIINEEDFAKKLLDEGYTEEQIYKPKALEGITKLTKLLGRKDFNTLSKGYVIKPEGKPTLVPESDKRPPIDNVNDDFTYEERKTK